MSYTKNMFDSIKESLTLDTKKQSSSFKDFLKPTAGNTYVVRLIPNIKDAAKTFFHYYHYGWQSVATGQYVDVLSPKTWGDKDPIEGERIKLYRDKSNERAIALAKMISTKEKWLVNVYIVDDPVTPENNGTIKILRYGSQLDKIIRSAIAGEDAEEYGPAIFDLSENGCNLRIKVESTKEGARAFVNYSASRFLRASAIPNMTPDRVNEILNGIHDLSNIFNRPSPEEIKTMVSTHLYGKDDDSSSDTDSNQGMEPAKLNIKSVETKAEVKNEAPPKNETVASPSDNKSDEDKIKELLAGL